METSDDVGPKGTNPDVREQLQETLAGAYVLGRELGGGGMSRVFLAEDTRLGRTIVIKLLAPELAAGINAERFEREIRMVASLQQANIVPLLTAGDTQGLPYFTMPYVEGQSLRARLAAPPPLSIAECVSILRDVARALGYAHDRGVVHRDIKPDNVLLSRGAAEVTDFGIAKALDAARVLPGSNTLTGMGTSIGTPAYMSPEQAAGDPALDHRADVYAWGVLAYEMLAGRPPFSGTPQAVMAAHVSLAPAPIVERADVPPWLTRLVMTCLSKDPAQRPQSADELLAQLEAVATGDGMLSSASRMRPRRVAAWAGAILVIAATLWYDTADMRRERWVRAEAIPKLREHIELGQTEAAYRLARQINERGFRDSVMTELWPRFARKVVLHSTPEGARVYRASFDDTTWTLLGTTPTDSLYLPVGWGRVRAELTGHRTQYGLLGAGVARARVRQFLFDLNSAADSDMVHVPGGTYGVSLVGMESINPLPLGDYLMDQREVTNRQFKAFVDAGGYTRREYWPLDFANGGTPTTWDAAVASFKDGTGRTGPSTWEAGEYRSGEGDLPVGGVSWYEAAAYAKFAGKSLPTVFHWAQAANTAAAGVMIPGSNVDGPGPVRGGRTRSMSAYGVYDMAGNVREWCENAGAGDDRYILGGGWSDQADGFTAAYAQPAMDRSPINGIRLVKYPRNEPALAAARGQQKTDFRNYAQERPAPDAAFEAYRQLFDYDPLPLNAKVEVRDTTGDEWILERVSFDAAYGNERMLAYLLLPKNATGAFQPVVYFPGASVFNITNSAERRDQVPSFVVKTGRALVLPILKSTYERRDGLRNDRPDSTIFWRQHVVMWVQDVQRTLDYLATRADMDTSRIAYFGTSWGANQGPVNLALEPRFKTGILYVAGLAMERTRPETDPLNYLPRVKVPVLMLNGKYDFFFPIETGQKPFFRLLGTPPEHKQYIVYEGGHDVPRVQLIAETLKWLDKYLGPVKATRAQ